MASTVIFLKVFGLTYSLIGLSILLNKKVMKAVVDDFVKHKAIAFWFAILPLMLGSFMITVHNSCGSLSECIVTVLGWLYLLGGCYRLFCFESWLKMATKCKKHLSHSWVGIFVTALGLSFCYLGF